MTSQSLSQTDLALPDPLHKAEGARATGWWHWYTEPITDGEGLDTIGPLCKRQKAGVTGLFVLAKFFFFYPLVP